MTSPQKAWSGGRGAGLIPGLTLNLLCLLGPRRCWAWDWSGNPVSTCSLITLRVTHTLTLHHEPSLWNLKVIPFSEWILWHCGLMQKHLSVIKLHVFFLEGPKNTCLHVYTWKHISETCCFVQEGDLANSFCWYLFALTAVYITKRSFMIWAASLTGAWGIFSFLTGLGIYPEKSLSNIYFCLMGFQSRLWLISSRKTNRSGQLVSVFLTVYIFPHFLVCFFCPLSNVPWGHLLASTIRLDKYHSFQGPEMLFIIEIHIIILSKCWPIQSYQWKTILHWVPFLPLDTNHFLKSLFYRLRVCVILEFSAEG